MPAQEILDAAQIALLLDLAGIAPVEASPLPPAAPAAFDSSAATRLRERGLLIDEPNRPRPNAVLRAVLDAAARPEEVLALRVTGNGMPGFAFVRQGRLWAQVATDAAGATHFAYPLSRATMIATVAGALSGTREELPPVGFHFRGPAGDGLFLSAIAARGSQGIAATEASAVVRAFVDTHSGAGVAAALADPGGLRALATDPTDALARLRADGHVTTDGMRIVAARRARAVLGTPPEAGFVATRTTDADSTPHVTGVQFWRCGGRILAVRAVSLADGAPGLDWSDLQKADARALIAAIYSLDLEPAR